MNKIWWDFFCLFGEIQKNCVLVFSTQKFIIFSHFSSLSPGFEATTWISRLTVLREKTKLNSTITQSMWGSAGWNWMMIFLTKHSIAFVECFASTIDDCFVYFAHIRRMLYCFTGRRTGTRKKEKSLENYHLFTFHGRKKIVRSH